MRVLCYAQALSGVGHDVRMRAIARGLAAAHEVHVVAGGRAAPYARAGDALRTVTLPAVARVGGALVSLDGTVDMVTAFEVEGDRVVTIRMVRNPDKLAHVGAPPTVR